MSLGFIASCSRARELPGPGKTPDGGQQSTPTSAAGAATTTAPLGAELCRPVDVEAYRAGSHDNNLSFTIAVVVTDLGVGPCLLPLFLDATLVNGTGEALPIKYSFFREPTTPAYFLAEPGQPVGFLIVWTNWCQGAVAEGVTIRLRLSEQMSPLDIPSRGAGQDAQPVHLGGRCIDSATGSQVSISQIVPGIPDASGP